MDKNEKKAMLRAWREKQKKTYLLKKPQAKSLFNYLHKSLDKAPCDHTLCHTKEWLQKKYPDQVDLINQALQEMQEDGGFCDCEVLLNCYERYELE